MRFFHRDLSWLEFNRRVLAQASDESMPILDRIRFLSIFTSNLDEFFMKRVGIMKRFAVANPDATSPDGLTGRQQLARIRDLVEELTREQHRVFEQDIIPAMMRSGVALLRYADLSPRDKEVADDWYRENVFPALTPLAVNPAHRFPFISNLSDNIGVLVSAGSDPRAGVRGVSSESTFARVKLPSGPGSFVRLPRLQGFTHRFVPLAEVIRANLKDLFPGMHIREQLTFRVTRSSGIQRDEPETGNLLQSIEADLKARRFARVARVEVERDVDPRLVRWLLDKLNVDPQDVYERASWVDFTALGEIADIDRAELRFVAWKGVVPPRLAPSRVSNARHSPSNFFTAIRRQDILVHHPYESFDASVGRFIEAAAADPDVLTIKQTLYRTTPDSPFIASLVRAAEAGKQVACLVELRARFDEGRNVRFARQLEQAGVHVAYGVLGLKTHCKTSLVVRREKQGLRCYAHLGTGNYHPKTAQLYTDLGLLTCDPEITGDLVQLFNYLTGLATSPSCQTLLVAPFTMRERLTQLIEREIAHARKGRPARIWAKLNALEDREMTELLYRASQAGVQVRLVVRGFCCLVPGVPGLSENIRVSSVVGRFLEHSRIYHFGAGERHPRDGDWYISSADWMYRNLSNRVEVACPVRDADACERLVRIFQVHELDHVNAWDLRSDGVYVRRARSPDSPPDSPQSLGTFETLMRDARDSRVRRPRS